MSTLDFVAIDFETANRKRASACQVGLARIEDGRIVDTQGWYIVPPTGADDFDPMNIRVHGITPAKVVAEGISWAESVDRMTELIAGLPLVAHNSSFDRSVYTRANELVGISAPIYRWEDTVALSRRSLPGLRNHKLHTVTDNLGIEFLNHHDAAADAIACARIVQILAQRAGGAGFDELWTSSIEVQSAVGAGGKQRFYKSGYSVTSGELPKPNPDADPNHPLFGRHVVVTGELPTMTRMDVYEALAARGAVPQKSFIKKTDVLIVADRPELDLGYDPSVGTGKEKKAYAALLEGRDIQLIGGNLATELLKAHVLHSEGSGEGDASTVQHEVRAHASKTTVEHNVSYPSAASELVLMPYEQPVAAPEMAVVLPRIASDVKLEGTSFAASGKIKGLTRDQLFAVLESHGALTQAYVSARTDILILADRSEVPSDLDLSLGKTPEKQAHKLLQSGHDLSVMGTRYLWELLDAAEHSSAKHPAPDANPSSEPVPGPDEPDLSLYQEPGLRTVASVPTEAVGLGESVTAAELLSREPTPTVAPILASEPSVNSPRPPRYGSTGRPDKLSSRSLASLQSGGRLALAITGWVLLVITALFVVATVATFPELVKEQGIGSAIVGAGLFLLVEGAVVWLGIWMVLKRKSNH